MPKTPKTKRANVLDVKATPDCVTLFLDVEGKKEVLELSPQDLWRVGQACQLVAAAEHPVGQVAVSLIRFAKWARSE